MDHRVSFCARIVINQKKSSYFKSFPRIFELRLLFRIIFLYIVRRDQTSFQYLEYKKSLFCVCLYSLSIHLFFTAVRSPRTNQNDKVHTEEVRKLLER